MVSDHYSYAFANHVNRVSTTTASSMMATTPATTTDTDRYFKAVEDGDLEKVKELLREKRVHVDITNQVWHELAR